MRMAIITGIMILGATKFAVAGNQSEETCKQQVQATLVAISVVEDKTGEKKDIKGLTKEAIEEMLKTMSYCEVAKEIARKTMH